MRALGAWVLLGAVCAGSAQLQFNVTKSVVKTNRDERVILPCIVTNLALNNIRVMFVKWKLEKKEFFSFDGSTEKNHRNKNFSSASLAFPQNLKFGVASLSISNTQAVPGNYSCEVTESNREGETVIELVSRRGSAQLQFNVTKPVVKTNRDERVILPCRVTNLALNNIRVMFVKWKLEKKEFFSFDGSTGKSTTNKNFSSAKLNSTQDLKFGDASLSISNTQAVPGNYSCEVTESNREGETVIELLSRRVSWFTPVENGLIILFMVLAILFYWIQFAVTVSKFETTLLKISLIIAGVVITVFAVVGFSLLISDEFKPQNQIGLGLIVLPAVILVPSQYFLLQTVSENLSFAIGVIVLESLGYLIAVIGFGLCVTAAGHPKNSAVVIAGLAIMALTALVGLIHAILTGSSKKNQPSTMQKE
ncbi:leukocyte surface antigen CD47 isoform X4 [Mauremys reevesii]|uniref:leukocyte surface antigen CD47 isoform X4 n=1 Tax=Mauremys reevesii TaxID=260615 RepID=UPI00193F4D65|nr:leukocyte surface antigen CD47 isoform X4 [Mauremys reevesii]